MNNGRVRGSSLFLFALLMGLLPVLVRPAWGTTADDICLPSADPCEVSSSFTITDLSLLDFGTRTLIIRQGGKLDVGPGQMTIRAGSLTIDSGGSLRAQPNGDINVVIDGGGVNDGAVLMNGNVLVDGGSGPTAGTFSLQATGSVELRGNAEIDANGTASTTDGGEIFIASGGDIVIDGKSLEPSVKAKGGSESAGGLIEFLADGNVQVLEKVTADGGALDGGEIDIEAKGNIEVAKPITADGLSSWGFGGVVTLIADADVVLSAKVSAQGALGTVEGGSGDGGEILILAGGALDVGGQLLAEGGVDGTGGDIDVTSLGDLTISQVISANGRGAESGGGDISIDGKDVNVAAQVSCSGGRGGGGFLDIFGTDDIVIGGPVLSNGGGGGDFDSGDGGEIGIYAGDDLTINGNIKARGSGTDGFGGLVDLVAGDLLAGGVLRQESGIIKVAGNDTGGGFGGWVDGIACVVEQVAGATIDAGGSGGAIILTSREAMTIGGSISADSATGDISLVYRTGSNAPVILPTASLNPFDPAADVVPSATVPACPVCGNGVVEAPEECDDGGELSGDGCDENCRLECGNRRPDPGEECDDGNRLDGDCCSATCTFEPAGSTCWSDGKPCTLDQCDGTGSCQHIDNDGAPCDDGLFCNGDDTCQGGLCAQHTGNPCPQTECNRCNETDNSCFDPLGTPCTEDGNECTLDRCDGGGTCTHPPRAAGAPCSTDGNECTDDVCDGAGACTHSANNAPCDDGLFCNGQDVCQGGGCNAHTGDPCTGGPECNQSCNEVEDNCFDPAGTQCSDEGNECTDDVCDGAGVCAHPPNTAPCDDGDVCTSGDTCNGGVCTAGQPIDCDDGNPCTDDSCVPSVGCVHDPNSAPCDDGVFCNGADTCEAGSCSVHEGDPCPGTPCTACDESAEVCADPAGAPCDDSDPCTLTDQCDGSGTCVGGGSVCGNGSLESACGEECDDGGTVVGDGCDAECIAEVCGNGKIQAGEECDDGNTVSGDGCSACVQDVPLPLIPGSGPVSNDCVMAWAIDPVPPLVKGFPTEKVLCKENDPSCDFDDDRSKCTLRVWMCVNESIPGKECVPPEVTEAFLLKKPRPDKPKDQVDAINAAVLEGAMQGLGIDILRQKAVLFDGPGVTTPHTCTRRLDIAVPISPGRSVGKRLLKALAVGVSGENSVKDVDKLKLFCFR